ncbi:ricin-like [Mercurialis annua]|uniref:ricin-like n=1 Tax=Mercurialis annua TaxID=3986 RepID=UPI00215F51AF|nr:ricin-like [Mercurialis annua]
MKHYENSVWLCMGYMMVFWFCFGSTPVQSESNQTSSVTVANPIVRLVLPSDEFDVALYIDFIENLRGSLRDPDEDPSNWHGYTALRRGGINLPRPQRFQLVELSIQNHEAAVTLALNSTNVYIAGFLAGDRLHYFPDTSDVASIAFPNVHIRYQLPFGEGYDSLRRSARESREQIPLGARPLYNAILNLYSAGRSGPIGQRQQGAARDLTIIIQMISEAARNSIIAGRLSFSIYNHVERVPDPDMIRYENRWGRLSGRIQTAGPNGVFEPVDLLNRRNERFDVSNVNDLYVRAAMALVLNSCSAERQAYDGMFSPLIIRSVVTDYEEDVCEVYEEPIVRIVGPNGLCADVKDNDYHNGNGVILWPCKSNSDVNQLWTIKRNGMIQSNTKCLTPFGFNPGDYMMIYDCPSQVDDKTRWQVWDNGTLMSGTGLALSANSVAQGTLLKVETNTYTTSQSWRPTSITQPLFTSIIGLNRLCLQLNENGYVWLEKCVPNNEDQTWILYPDGSIRPQRNQQSCLFGDPDHVQIVTCNLLSSGQRWEFKSDGSILNLYYNMVLDVKQSDPSLKQIMIYPFHESANQKWSLVF